MNGIGRWIILGLVMVLAAGCTGKHKLVAGAPDWVNQGSGAFDQKDARVFYGVGSVTGIASPSLAVQTADQRSRADIAAQMETYVANLFRDYQASTAATTGNQRVEEQHVEGDLKALTQVSVRGARVVEHWRNPDTDTIYALTRLDLQAFAASLEQMPEMNPALKTFVRSNAEKAFDRLRQEEHGK